MEETENIEHSVHRDSIPDGLDDTEIVVVDSAQQALWFRIGQVYTDGKPDRVPGIWILYQNKYMADKTQGPILLSPEIWNKIVEEVNCRIQEWTTSTEDTKNKDSTHAS